SLTHQAGALTKERLNVSREAALLLKAVHYMQEPLQDEEVFPDPRRHLSRLKQEVPLLKSDPHIDLENFGSTDLPDLNSVRIPLEHFHTEDDEGPDWPTKYLAYPTEYFEAVKNEKLAVSRDHFIFLQHSIRDTYTDQDAERIKAEDVRYKRVKSDGSDQMLLEFDVQNTDSGLPQETLEQEYPAILKRKANDLKVEGPLTPEMFSESPMKKMKSVSFLEMLHEDIPDLPSHFESGDDVLDSQDSFNGFYKEIAPLAEEVNKRLENEKLSEVDTTRRVDVPELDFILPIAPWDEFGHKKGGKHPIGETELAAQAKFLVRVKRNDLKSTSSWHGLSKLERDLHWRPFPFELASISNDEKLQDDGSLSELLADVNISDIATSSTDVWKRDGLRLLDEEDSEDELEAADLQEQKDMQTLIRQRRLELQEEQEAIERVPRSQQGKGVVSALNAPRRGFKELHSGVQPPVAQRETQRAPEREKLSKKVDNSLMFGGMFSASTALHKFMKVHGRDVPEPEVAESRRDQLAISDSNAIEKIYSIAELIERDFALPNSPSQEADLLLSPSTGLLLTSLQAIKQKPLPGQPDRSPLKARISTLQLRYERLVILVSEGLSREVEEAGSSRLTDVRDKEALKELETFCSTLAAEILVKYVGGGEAAYTRAIVDEMARWGLPQGEPDIGDLKLMQEETLWELFLRRSGLNPFAAQIILASLKDPYELPLRSPSQSPARSASVSAEKRISVYGLPSFVLMAPEDRVSQFQALLGGSRVLGRVSAVLDQSWPCAAHGF
ncbi:hypothetical protein BCR34DRAFT_470026, partial [Clohesyomyces aquaticus]